MTGALLYGAVALAAFGLVEHRLARTSITGPMIFVLLGILASSSMLGIIVFGSTDLIVDTVLLLFQTTLALVLFTDAAALNVSWRRDADLPGRLLGIGLPLTIAFGAVTAALLFTDLSVWEAAVIGAMIAPTDAALGAAVIANERVPVRIRQALDIESGLNDGVSLPFLLIFLAFASKNSGSSVVETFASEIGIAIIGGLVVGWLGAWLLVRAWKAGWTSVAWSNIVVVAIALIAFVSVNPNGGSGFIATFVAGLVFGSMTRGKVKATNALATELGSMSVQLSFLMFGALLLIPYVEQITWQVVVMVIVALTVARIVPVAIAMIGTKLALPSLLYMGWFGPRGLATVVYAAVVASEHSDLAGLGTITSVAMVTVGVSIFAHGITAYPGSQRYADWYEGQSSDKISEAKSVHHVVHQARHHNKFSRQRTGDTPH